MRSLHPRSGFTLVELMVVVGVISLMITIIAQPMAKAREEAKLQACVENLKGFGVAYQSYLADNPNVRNGSNATMWTNLVPRYLAKVPTCPSSGYSTMQSFGGGTSFAGYVWANTGGSDPFPYVMCLGGHNNILPASRGVFLGPLWSPRTGADACRTGNPQF